MRTLWIGLIISSLAFISCQSDPSSNDLESGPAEFKLNLGLWRAEVQMQGQKMPFQFELEENEGSYRAYILNDEERLEINEIEVKDDSIIFPLHILGAELRAKRIDDQHLQGKWIKYDYDEPYELSFEAEQGPEYRFAPAETSQDFSGKWAVSFQEEDGSSYPAIGVFEQDGSKLSGTFLTKTGDYRYLQGNANGDTLQLSTFDGGHGFLFKAHLEGDSLKGTFWSGKSSQESFTAYRDAGVQLPDANSLTYLKEGYEGIEFAFPRPNGDTLKFPNPDYKGKVLIIQVMGTWCPNCMDETNFYVPFYEKNKDRGFEIIALCYERSPEFEKAAQRVRKMQERYEMEYATLIAGVNDKQKTSETLPMLNQIISYPTSIYIDRQGKVRRIHTGFSGPGTGIYYEKFSNEFYQFMEKLLAEPAS